jgi:hypothetical protein
MTYANCAQEVRVRKPPSKKWVLIAASCAIGAIVVERVLVLYEPKYRQATAAETSARRCALASARVPALFDEDPPPLVAQPGGIDPLGLSGAIHRALEDCP